ncbi:MAG: hypothetical protein K0S20_685 [Patescibacteria group bacterium]|jgi:hypothetical protein|nr:hypothetical protein [Patescibacteria group bacterium]
MSESPEYIPGSAIPRDIAQPAEAEQSSQVDHKEFSPEEEAATDSMSQAARIIIELCEGDVEVTEMIHRLGNELNLLAHYNTGQEHDVESKKTLMKRVLQAAAVAAKGEIGRG